MTHARAHISAVEEAGQICRGRGGRLCVSCVSMLEQKKKREMVLYSSWAVRSAGRAFIGINAFEHYNGYSREVSREQEYTIVCHILIVAQTLTASARGSNG